MTILIDSHVNDCHCKYIHERKVASKLGGGGQLSMKAHLVFSETNIFIQISIEAKMDKRSESINSMCAEQHFPTQKGCKKTLY